ncbi:MAG TPA: hypothetical protein VN457_06110, partial [Chlamydiales bacterium]|nr:hypothetical protein [Chlamydiales bacterium]
MSNSLVAGVLEAAVRSNVVRTIAAAAAFAIAACCCWKGRRVQRIENQVGSRDALNRAREEQGFSDRMEPYNTLCASILNEKGLQNFITKVTTTPQLIQDIKTLVLVLPQGGFEGRSPDNAMAQV